MGFFDKFQAAIFDLDGTLIDSMHLWDHVASDWLISLGKTPDSDCDDSIKTMPFSESVLYMTRRYGLSLSAEEIRSQWIKMVEEAYLAKVPLKKGAGDLVKALAARGIKLGMATSSFPHLCEGVLSRHQLRHCFSSIVYTDEMRSPNGQVRNKSCPDIWLAAASRLGTLPGKCVVFEDLPDSLLGCHSAGIGGFVAIFDDATPDWPSLKAAADLALDYPGEALKLL
ncbi:HAD family hydrolase [Leadbettera azotonutricia]|uniref:HAD-superfamily hydrolase, subfamily IA, variant 3 n=1 Tax=Leadbettera azotonutricia (strain ATCC BAA-888 / DSM 13862 / ZAS-9) TaxID=545695 RepID=F5YB59_LEAAZ|nr:HAD family phosphatase [Leadbettera azotonutricia]AEF82612.1 HAD-superfamily hydrolase, subfamily IA, variant 3 [Leadbettera azotonutricia ZAS-9]